MTTLSIRLAKSREWALSRSYAVLVVDRHAVRTADADGSPFDQSLVLAVGVLPNGESEIAGTWPDPQLGSANLDRFFDELKIRGVERIGLVVDAGGVICEDQLHKSYPSARAWTSVHEATCPNEASHTEGKVRSMALPVPSFRTMNAIETHARRVGVRVSSGLKRQLRLKQSDDFGAYVVAAMFPANDLCDAAVAAEVAVQIGAKIASRQVQSRRSS
jgi:hypothetical protein